MCIYIHTYVYMYIHTYIHSQEIFPNACFSSFVNEHREPDSLALDMDVSERFRIIYRSVFQAA